MKTVRLQVQDSMTRFLSKDTVLGVATEEELAKYFGGRAKLDPGKVWDGFLKPMLNAMDAKARDEILELASSMHEGPSEALVSDEKDPDEDEEASVKHRTNDGPTTLRKWRDATGNVVDSINEANRKFHGQRSLKP